MYKRVYAFTAELNFIKGFLRQYGVRHFFSPARNVDGDWTYTIQIFLFFFFLISYTNLFLFRVLVNVSHLFFQIDLIWRTLTFSNKKKQNFQKFQISFPSIMEPDSLRVS